MSLSEWWSYHAAWRAHYEALARRHRWDNLILCGWLILREGRLRDWLAKEELEVE